MKNSRRSAARFSPSIISAPLGPSADHFLILKKNKNILFFFSVFLPLQSYEDQNLRAGTPREEKAFPLGGDAGRDVILLILLHLRHYELSAIHTTQLTLSDRGGGWGGLGGGGVVFISSTAFRMDSPSPPRFPLKFPIVVTFSVRSRPSETQGLFDLDLQTRTSGLVTFSQMETKHTHDST